MKRNKSYWQHVLLSCCLVIVFSCSSDSNSDMHNETAPEALVLKQVNFQLTGEPVQEFIGFSEIGLPVEGSVNTFSYDSENKLIESNIYGGSGFYLPRIYTYSQDELIGLDLPSFGFSDGVIVLQGEIIYESGNSIVHTLYQNDEASGGIVYSFLSESYNHISSIGYFDDDNSSNVHQRYDYEYDANMNLILVNEFEVDLVLGLETLVATYDITYDNKLNPFYKFRDHHPIVFNLLPFDFDSQSLVFVEPHLRRNAEHNVVSILRTRVSDGAIYNFSFDYEYNDDDYPIIRNRYHGDGSLLHVLEFEYY